MNRLATFKTFARLASLPMCRQSTLAAVNSSRLTVVRSFAMSSAKLSHGEVDSDLSQRLKEEINFEKQEFDVNEVPEWLASFQKKGTWKIVDTAGEKEVTFVRHFGNEKLSVIFSTDAVNEAQELEDVEGEEADGDFPVNVTILIEKKKDSVDFGCLEINAQVSQGTFFIENLTYGESSKLMADYTAEGEWQRRLKYGGPVFSDLDDGVQDLFHKFLEERGFDEELANAIGEYATLKEQKEYMNWLEQTEKFIRA